VAKQAHVELTSWTRFDTPHVTIAPELLGRSHVFSFEGHEIDIRLPTAESLPEYDEPGRYVVGDRLSLNTWKAGTFLWVDVHNVDVVVNIPDRTPMPEEARTTPITHEYFSEEEEKRLDELATRYGDLAYRAFDLWIRTLRWKADDYRMGTPELSGVKETGSRTEIREKDSPNRFWAGGQEIILFVGKPVTVEVWNKVSVALDARESPPIFYDLLYSAMARLERGDLRLTIIDAAVAAETYMKTTIDGSLPPSLDAKVRKYISRARMPTVLDDFFPACLDAEQSERYSSLKPDLRNLFKDRNEIMHSGQKEGLTETYCQKIINSVHELVSLDPRKAT
jgi:hypothetical protein